jgi:hypothetical protein
MLVAAAAVTQLMMMLIFWTKRCICNHDDCGELEYCSAAASSAHITGQAVRAGSLLRSEHLQSSASIGSVS